MDDAVRQKLSNFHRLCSNLQFLDKHDALFLLKNSLAMPRLTYTLRTAPCFGSPVVRHEFDHALRETLELVINCDLSETQWEVASLPVAKGGLGIRSTKDVSLPAFISSVKAAESIARIIYPQYANDTAALRAIVLWDATFSTQPQGAPALFQRSWDTIATSTKVNALLTREGISDFDKACLLKSEVCSVSVKTNPQVSC